MSQKAESATLRFLRQNLLNLQQTELMLLQHEHELRNEKKEALNAAVKA